MMSGFYDFMDKGADDHDDDDDRNGNTDRRINTEQIAIQDDTEDP